MASNLFKITVVQHWLYDCWIDRKGVPCAKNTPGARFVKQRRVKPGTPGAKKVKKKSAKWYGRVPGSTKPLPLSKNKVAAQQILAGLVKKAELRKAGISDPFEGHRTRALAEHLDDYRRYLEAEGRCMEHVAKACARIRAILDGCGFLFIPDITPEKVAEFLHGLRRDPARPALPVGQDWFTPRELVTALGGIRPPRLARMMRREGLSVAGQGKARRYPRATVEALQDRVCRGIGIATSNGYLTAAKGFSRWLVRTERTDRDRLVSLSRQNARTDVRHARRATPEDELRVILTAAGDSHVEFEGLTGRDRRMLYLTAMVTGFRASELASLTPLSFLLEENPPTVAVTAAYSKNHRHSVQPLPTDVAAALRGFLADRPAGLPVWSGGWYKDAAEMLRIDLSAAGIPYRDAEGRVADFHGLRHSYISLLAANGATPKEAQELARHSDIRLTMNTYTHVRLHDLASAVEALPSLLGAAPGEDEVKFRATGTDPVCTGFVQTDDAGGGHLRPSETLKDGEGGKRAGLKPLGNQGLEAACDSPRLSDPELPGQDSNLDKESQNPSVRTRKYYVLNNL
jgi:integrase